MIFRGWEKLSLVEWPDRVCSVIFVGGCNFNCPWCYNQLLVKGWQKLPAIESDEILAYLKENKKFLDGVMITGGEPLKNQKSLPCRQAGKIKSQNYSDNDLTKFIKQVKKLGLGVGIETNGTNPNFLEYLLDNKLIDYVAMDIKAPISSKFSENFDTKLSVRRSPRGEGGQPQTKYEKLTGVKVDLDKIKKSIELIKAMAPDYEFRTTVVPGLLIKEDLIEIAKYLRGAKRFYLQEFQSKLMPDWHELPFLNSIADELEKTFNGWFGKFGIRG